MALYSCLFFMIVIFSAEHASGSSLSSLTFVIDDTSSMYDDIAQVRVSTMAIFNTVLTHSDESQIDNFILVTFNDDSDDDTCRDLGKVKAKTKNRDEFMAALAAIRASGGARDCEECSMAGIKLGLDESLPRSTVYVFTDASSKDFHRYEEVKRLAIEKQAQIVFVLTGQCGEPTTSPKYQVYEDIAFATKGQVFHVKKNEVSKVIEYVKKTVIGRMYTPINKVLPPGSSTLNFTADALMGEVLFSIASAKSSDPSVSIKDPDGSDIWKRIVFDTDKAKVYAFNATKSGVHKVHIDNTVEARAMLSVKSGIDFGTGFSTIKLDSLVNTSSMPAPGVKSHLSIKLNKGDIALKKVQILDINDNVINELPLEVTDNVTQFYTTPKFYPPNIMFKISIIGYHAASGSNITREVPTLMEYPKPIAGKVISPRASSVVIQGGPKINANYNEPLELTCNVEGYPKPDIVWKNKNTGAGFPTDTLPGKDHDYDHINVLSIEKVTENATYSCDASNPTGKDSKEIAVEVIRKRYLKITSIAKNITAEYEKKSTVSCAVDSYPPAEITWYKNDKAFSLATNVKIQVSHDNSVVTIENSTIEDEGKYTCEAKNEDNTQSVDMYVTIVGLELPEIDKHVTNVFTTKSLGTTIECKILKGKPKPSISWTFESTSRISTTIDKWKNQEEIAIDKADKVHSGIYQCQAENYVGSDQHKVNLLVEYSPTIIKNDKKEVIAAKTGSEVSVSCNVDAAPPPAVTWLKNNVKITNSTKIHISNKYTLSFIADSSDSGDYVCRATNRHGTDDKNVELYVTEPPEIDKHVTNVFATRGLGTTIECKVLKGKPKPSISWTFESTSRISTTIDKWKNQEEIAIDKADKVHSGIYQCQAENYVGSDQHKVNLLVEYSPTIIKNDKKEVIAAKTGSEVSVSCNVDAAPPPAVTWLKNNVKITNSTKIHISNKYTLSFIADSSDSGDYVCRATNRHGTDDKNVELYVTEPPEIDKHVTNVFATRGLGTTIECKVLKGKPKPSISWTFESTSRISTTIDKWKNQEEIAIDKADKVHSGIYQCQAENYVGSDQHKVNLLVEYSPTIIKNDKKEVIAAKTGSEVSVSCNVDAAPPPAVTWLKNNVKITNSTKIHISNKYTLSFIADSSDSGDYVCRATNRHGTDDKNVELYVTEPPEIDKHVTNVFATRGLGTTIECKVLKGKPKPSISWTFESTSRISTTIDKWKNQEEIAIDKADKVHSGIYQCQAENYVGSDQHKVNLLVEYSPTIIKNDKKEVIAAKTGSEVSVSCNVDAAPPPAVTWLKNNVKITNSTKIHISNKYTLSFIADSSDSGDYVCRATNRHGTDDKNVELYVTEPPEIDKHVTNVFATRGLGTTIECKVLKGKPKPSISWTFESTSRISTTIDKWKNQEEIAIDKADKVHSGIYQCQAENYVGSDQHKVNLLVEYSPTIIKNDKKEVIAAKTGSEVSVSCNVDAAPPPAVTWLKNNVKITNSTKILISNKYTLSFIADSSDSGDYVCRATNRHGTDGKNVELYVTEPPEIDKHVTNVFATRGLGTTIECKLLKGKPKPSISWTFESTSRISTTIDTWKNQEEIAIDKADKVDSGIYQCHAENDVGSDQHKVNLLVEYSPTIIKNDKKETIKVKIGSEVSITCDIDSSPPPRVIWLKDKVEIIKSTKIHISDYFTISFIADLSDTGEYICRATNKVGTNAKTVELYVTEPPEIDKHVTSVVATKGLRTTIECKILKGTPKPSISWTFGTTSKILSTVEKWKNQERIVIDSASEVDSGIYQCQVENEVGSDQHDVKLIVEYFTKIDKTDKKELITVENGSDVSIRCNVDGVPPLRVTWLKNDVEITSSTKFHISSTNTISFVADSSDTGHYKCHATNKLGTDDKTVKVFVTVPPSITPPKQLNKTLLVGTKRSTLSCKATGTPVPDLKWTYKSFDSRSPPKELLKFKGVRLFKLENIEISHEGNYTCTVSNSAGSKAITYSVHVLEVPRFDESTETKVSVERGLSTKLECKIIKGKPKPTLSWFFRLSAGDRDAPANFKEIIRWKNKESVIVKNADKMDSGIYQCRAKNVIRTEYHDINLLVEYPPKIVSEKKDKKFKKAKIGQEVSIPCIVDGSLPLHVTWLKNDVELIGDGKPYTIEFQVLKFVAQLAHAGNYTCKAQNKIGSDSKTVKVDVIDPVKIVIPRKRDYTLLVGSDVTLPCKSRGTPKPSIKWTFQGFSDPEPSKKILKHRRDHSLNLKHIQVPEAGYYTCTAVNTGTLVNVTYQLQVFAPAMIVNTYKEKRFVVVEGDLALQINCNVTGNPKPAIIWTKDGSALTLGTTYFVEEGTLIILNVPKEASGSYRCKIDNPRAVVAETYEVIVKKYPPLDRAASTVYIEVGQREQIKCSLPHAYTDQLRWYKDEELIFTGELLISGATLYDSGYYSCRVGTHTKSYSTGVEVFVGFRPHFRKTIENENVNIIEESPQSFNCEVDSKPEALITWYHNDKQLELKDEIYDFPMGITSPGQYRCEAMNTFGNISRTFYATREHCLIDFSTLNIMAPLMLNSRLSWIVPEKTNKNMKLPEKTPVILFCPNGFDEFPKLTNITAFCNGDTNFLINGLNYNYLSITCIDEVRHTARSTGVECLPGNSVDDVEKISVGYSIIDEVETVVYEVCFDKRNEIPIYTKQIMQNVLSDDDFDITWSDTSLFKTDFDQAYDCANQIETVSTLLDRWFHNVDRCCFFKRQLVNSKDVFPGNWNEIEHRVRKLAKILDNNLMVWTGIAQKLSLQSTWKIKTDIFISDFNDNQQPVPAFLWKVVQDPASLSSLAIIQVNVPDLHPTEVSKYTLCHDQCNEVDWMKNDDWHDVIKGYTYCCNLNAFEDAFEFKGVFEPNMYFFPTYTPDYD